MGSMRSRSTIHLPVEGALTLASLFEEDAAAALDNTLVETRAEVALFVDVLGVAHDGGDEGGGKRGARCERVESDKGDLDCPGVRVSRTSKECMQGLY